MYKYTDIVEKIKQDLPVDVQSIALAILDFLVSTPQKDSSSLSFGALQNIVKKRTHSDPDHILLISATHYFVGDRVHLLDPIFTFFDDQTATHYKIPQKEIAKATSEGFLTHPLTEDLIENYQNFITVSYSSNEIVNDIVNEYKSK